MAWAGRDPAGRGSGRPQEQGRTSHTIKLHVRKMREEREQKISQHPSEPGACHWCHHVPRKPTGSWGHLRHCPCCCHCPCATGSSTPSQGGLGPILGSVCSPWLLCTELRSGFGLHTMAGAQLPLWNQAWKQLGTENHRGGGGGRQLVTALSKAPSSQLSTPSTSE